LAFFVALVELPCTGAIYLAILSLIGDSGMIGLVYLLIYNLIFIAPLFVLTFIIYKGAKVEKLNEWVLKNRKFMRLAAGLIMIALSLSLLGIF
jgi:cytochrome c biogenesis protein CcdA